MIKFNLFETEVTFKWSILIILLIYMLPFVKMDLMISIDSMLQFIFVVSLIMIHEFGHILTAKYLGYFNNKITINFYGGIASSDRISEDNYNHILLITAAGPATNLFLCLIGFLFADLNTPYIGPVFFDLNRFFIYLFRLNTLWLFINMLPIPSLDGWWIYRSLWAKLMS